MFQRHAQAVCARSRSVCVVDGNPDCLKPGGGATGTLVGKLRARGAAVHVLYCGPGRPVVVNQGARGFSHVGADFSALDRQAVPSSLRVPSVHGPCHADRSDGVRHTLERLVKECNLDLIVFPALDGLGFRAVQAKRACLGFDQVHLAVRLDSCGAWQRDQEQRWPSGLAELEVDFAERYAFENADIRVACNLEMLDYVRCIGWTLACDDVVETGDDHWLASACSDFIPRATSETRQPPPNTEHYLPLVTVAIPHYNLGRYLPDALASLARQTYPNLEVVVIDDGSTDPACLAVLERMQAHYPRYRFLRQPNAGIGAARNRGLQEARGEYFIPMDADNVARPDMVERFVTAIQGNLNVAAMTCYFLAFAEGVPITREQYVYACRPTGGPHTLASIRNVYGDATAIFRTATFRAIGGFEIERSTSFEDWEVFVKLVNAGHAVGVIPEHLFYYRHRDAGFSRVTDSYRNHQRVLRQFLHLDQMPARERPVLWGALLGFHFEAERRKGLMRYRAADKFHDLCNRVPFATRGLKWLITTGGKAWNCIGGTSA